MPTIAELEREVHELTERLTHPARMPQGEFAAASSRLAKLRQILDFEERVARLKRTVTEHEQAKDSEDTDLRALAAEELPRVRADLARAEAALRTAAAPPDPHAGKDVVLEIRAGTGGAEAALFAQDLFSMYARYAERRGWTTTLAAESRSDLGGVKEVIVEITGAGVYGTLRWERGVHRVQRIPNTEKTGRIHTSTATVAVLPKATAVEVVLRPEDLRIDTFRAGGHGGQKVQKTDSAVRITHLPTGLVVQCQDERSQQRNKERALEVLRARLLQKTLDDRTREEGTARRAQIGTGDRSEKIRTYNVPQNRVTDHRIKQSWSGIERILGGDLDEIVAALSNAADARRDER